MDTENPLHYLAFARCPKFYDSEYLKTAVPGGVPVQKAPNQDKEVMRGVVEAFSKISKGMLNAKYYRKNLLHFT